MLKYFQPQPPGQCLTLQHRRCQQYEASLKPANKNYKSLTLQRNYWTNTTLQPPQIDNQLASPLHDESEAEVGLLTPLSVPTISSTISSSELNHSLVSSETSDLSSERDRESEV